MASLSKKGVVEVQIGWIFVIIVGSLILLFFFSVVKTTTKGSTDTKNMELRNSLNSMISQSEVDVGTTRTIGMPAIALNFDCNGFSIEGSSNINTNQFPYKTIFSPDTVKGREIITYSKYWEMPYSVDYFVYITSKEIRYNFINGSCTGSCKDFLNSLLKEMPANITKQVVSKSEDVIENNYYKERFIFINQPPPSPPSPVFSAGIDKILDADVTAINISSNPDNLNITYFRKNGNAFAKNKTTSYLGIPMLIGAIMSEASLYECNVNKSLNKFKVMTKIYLNRTIYLRDYYSGFNIDTPDYRYCYNLYNRIDLSTTLNYLSSNPFSNFLNIQKKARQLEVDDKELLIFSCAMVY